MSQLHKHHKHSHHHKPEDISGALLWSTVLNFAISIIQIIGGVISNSLSLISDSVHNLGDATAILGAYFADKIGKKKPSVAKTYGFKRAEIIAAFLNALILLVISSYLFIEAIKRFSDPEPIKGNLMLIVAISGLVINMISVFILYKKRKGNINVKAAYLHLLSDTYSSLAVIIGAIFIKFFDTYWVDPVVTIIVNIFIIKHTYHVFKESLNILMQAVPDKTSIEKLKHFMEENTWIDNVHHIHLWTMDGNKQYLECHIEFAENKKLGDAQQLLNQLSNDLQEEFDITHTTFQPEFECNHSKESIYGIDG